MRGVAVGCARLHHRQARSKITMGINRPAIPNAHLHACANQRCIAGLHSGYAGCAARAAVGCAHGRRPVLNPLHCVFGQEQQQAAAQHGNQLTAQ